MEIRNNELDRVTILLISFYVLSFLISPILLIWALNTLFQTGIALNLKNWLAGLVLIGMIKFLLKGKERVREIYEDYYRDEDEPEEDPDWEDEYDFPEADNSRRKAKLILYQNPKKNHKSPPEENS